jgi:hypothetical protein
LAVPLKKRGTRSNLICLSGRGKTQVPNILVACSFLKILAGCPFKKEEQEAI